MTEMFQTTTHKYMDLNLLKFASLAEKNDTVYVSLAIHLGN